MGHGSWTRERFEEYAAARYGKSADELEHSRLSAQEVFRGRTLNSLLDPRGVVRQCHDSEEHPRTLPVILALDVTGSMGSAASRTATRLNRIITDIFRSGQIRDVEFCMMAIGDIHYDRAPIQISQFESDIRIAEQLDAVYFEGGGGGNCYESYTAAWYMGLEHCELHCWNRGGKGLIITMGDEMPNPFLNARELNAVTGDHLQADLETEELLERTLEKFEVYHLSVNDPHSSYVRNQKRCDLDSAWRELLGQDRYRVVTIEGLDREITNIVTAYARGQAGAAQEKKSPWYHLW